jgi:hypothetical protein
MTAMRLPALILAPALALTGCVHSYARTTTWGEDGYAAQNQWERTGRVTRVRETAARWPAPSWAASWAAPSPEAAVAAR